MNLLTISGRRSPRFTNRLALCAVLCCASIGADGTNQTQDPAHRNPKLQRPFLVDAFPQTAELLKHLKTADPNLHGQLLSHSERLLRDSEKGALAFAREHHPELAEVLGDLRKHKQRKHAYARAIRHLNRDRKRIEQQRLRRPRTHDASIEIWKARSRLRLLAARMAHSKESDTLDTQFGSAVESLVRDLHRTQRRGHELRIERLRQQIEELEQRLAKDPEAAVQREIRAIRSNIARRKRR